MTSVSKEYEIKTKMEQEQCLLLKMQFLLFLLGYNLEIVAYCGDWLLVRGNKNLVGGSTGGIFAGGWGKPCSPILTPKILKNYENCPKDQIYI